MLSLSHILLGQQHIQSTAKHILHDRCVISSLQHDTHALALGLRVRILLVHHSNVSLSAEEDERIESLLVSNLVGLTALGCNSLTRGDAKSDGLGKVFRGKLDKDRVCISVDDLGAKLCLNHSLRNTQGFATGSCCGGCDAELSDWGCTRATLPVNRVCNDLVSKLKTVKDRSLGFIVIVSIFHLLLEFLSFFQEDVQRLGQNTHRHRVLIWLDKGTDSLSVDIALLILRVVLNVLQYISLLLEISHLCLRQPVVIGLVPIIVKSALADEGVWTQVVTDHVRRV